MLPHHHTESHRVYAPSLPSFHAFYFRAVALSQFSGLVPDYLGAWKRPNRVHPSPCGEMSSTFVGDLTQIVILSFASKDSTINLKRPVERDEISTLI